MTIQIQKAISLIKNDAEYAIQGTDIDTCEIIWTDGNPTNITKDQIKAKMSQAETEIADAAAKKVADKASGDAKLKALGLTDDEIEALRN